MRKVKVLCVEDDAERRHPPLMRLIDGFNAPGGYGLWRLADGYPIRTSCVDAVYALADADRQGAPFDFALVDIQLVMGHQSKECIAAHPEYVASEAPANKRHRLGNDRPGTWVVRFVETNGIPTRILLYTAQDSFVPTVQSFDYLFRTHTFPSQEGPAFGKIEEELRDMLLHFCVDRLKRVPDLVEELTHAIADIRAGRGTIEEFLARQIRLYSPLLFQETWSLGDFMIAPVSTWDGQPNTADAVLEQMEAVLNATRGYLSGSRRVVMEYRRSFESFVRPAITELLDNPNAAAAADLIRVMREHARRRLDVRADLEALQPVGLGDPHLRRFVDSLSEHLALADAVASMEPPNVSLDGCCRLLKNLLSKYQGVDFSTIAS